MASIRKRTRSDGSTAYQVLYRDPSGGQRSETFDRQSAAEAFRDEIAVAIRRGNWTDPKLGDTTLNDWSGQWLKTKRNLKPKTLEGYRSLLRSRILPELGYMPLRSIRRIDVEAWVSWMVDEDLSASRVRQAHQCLNAMLERAVDDGYIGRNPARNIDLPRLSKPSRRFLTADQVAHLAEVMDEPYGVLVLVLAYGGLRWGEGVALKRERCDLLRNRLHIVENAVEVGGTLEWGTPKADKSASVQFPGIVVDALARHLRDNVPDDPDALVFTAPQGGPLRYSNFRKATWDPARERADVPDDLTPHELRHTCAALLIADGVDPKAVSAQLRHSSVAFTYDVYGHLFDGHLDEVMDRLDEQAREARKQAVSRARVDDVLTRKVVGLDDRRTGSGS